MITEQKKKKLVDTIRVAADRVENAPPSVLKDWVCSLCEQQAERQRYPDGSVSYLACSAPEKNSEGYGKENARFP